MEFSRGWIARRLPVACALALFCGLRAGPVPDISHTVTVNEGTNLAATVSPDRRSIIIDLQAALWLMPANGGTAKRLTDGALEASHPDWSPKGDLVAFQSFSGGTFHLWVMKPDGTG